MLTDDKVAAATPLDRPYKLYDEKGLFLLVNPNGSKWWRFRYRAKGKGENLLSIGVFPEVLLTAARKRRDQLLEDLAAGVELSAAKKASPKARDSKATFMAIAEEWIESISPVKSPKTISKTRWILNSYVYPFTVNQWRYDEELDRLVEIPRKTTFGDLHVADIVAPQVFAVLKNIEGKGLIETAHRTKIRIAEVLRYARPKGYRTINVADDMRGVLRSAVVTSHPALIDPPRVAELMRWIYSYSGRPTTKAALKLQAILFPRPENLREMEWREIDFASATWIVPPEKLKGPMLKKKQALIVPLPSQALEILREQQKTSRQCQYVLPNDRGCIYPMSNNAITVALKRGGWAGEHSWHGFRAMARTMIEERLKFDPKYPEMQLAHEVKDPNGRAYNRTAFIDDRREMMQEWADYLDELRLSVASKLEAAAPLDDRRLAAV